MFYDPFTDSFINDERRTQHTITLDHALTTEEFRDYIQTLINCTEKEKWISVENKLPPDGNNVIVAIRDTSGDTPFTYTDCGWCLGEKRGWIVDNDLHFNVTHWQPLPEPPKERKRK